MRTTQSEVPSPEVRRKKRRRHVPPLTEVDLRLRAAEGRRTTSIFQDRRHQSR
jgi:hypothetical protein